MTEHHLLPHEERAASWLQRRSGSAAYVQLMRNAGPEGLRLQAAVWANGLPGFALLFAGLVARLVQLHSMPVAAICLLGLGFLMMAIAIGRTIQLGIEGRRFRADRRRS
jgi:tellurite resistance protein TehA-like permease